MPKPSDDCFEKQQQHSSISSSSNHKTASTTWPEPTETTKTESSLNPVTPAEYIFNSMIPPTKSPSETVEVVTLGKRERRNTGGSSKSGGPIMSMDLFLSPEDVELDGGLGALSSDDATMRLQSSDFVKDLFLPDTAATAAAALQAEHPPSTAGNGNAKLPSQQEESCQKEEYDDFCPIVNLTSQLEKISTADVVPLNENFRISSRDWVKDFAGESKGNNLGPMHPTLFMGNASSTETCAPPVSSPPPPTNRYEEYQIPLEPMLSSDWVKVAEQFSIAPPPLNPPPTNNTPLQSSGHFPLPLPALSNSNIMHNLPITSPTKPAAKSNTSPSSSITSKPSRKKKRMIDESRAVEPTANDVLFGRGGFTNTHLGNIKFRQKALELRPWYEQSSTSKDEKYRISDLLVESVKCEGHRFLERGDDGLWHEVVGNGARKKASQALRERVRGAKRSGGSTKAAASVGGGAVSVEELIGDLMPATVIGDVMGV
mmetsp:Transcript_26233/g.47265  ORF Transcript_26233/g.47265 Transcript_26233/m.47265 type:complete len:486 (+) Transcript_26233:83-1540(+)